MSGNVAWFALAPVLLMAGLLGVYESRRARAEPRSSNATSLALPALPLPRLQAGSYTVREGSLGVAVHDLFNVDYDRSTGVTGTLQVDAAGNPTALQFAIDLMPLAVAGDDPWQADALFALRDLASVAIAKFAAERVVVHAAEVPGVLALDCEGTLALHGHARRLSLTLHLGADRRDSAHLHGRLAVDIRTFGLPRSWRYGVVPMDPLVHVTFDATLARQGKGS